MKASEALAACRAALAGPVLGYLRFVEQLSGPVEDPAALVAGIEQGDVEWYEDCLPRLISRDHWRTMSRTPEHEEKAAWRRSLALSALAPHMLEATLEELPVRPWIALYVIRWTWHRYTEQQRAAFDWSRVLPYVVDRRRDVRLQAVELALCGRQITPAVIRVVEDTLYTAVLDPDDLGAELAADDQLRAMGNIVPPLASLAASLEPILKRERNKLRIPAIAAAIAMGARWLQPHVRRIAERQPSDRVTGSVACYGAWQLGGDITWFRRAFGYPDRPMYRRVWLSVVVDRSASEDRLLDALAELTTNTAWSEFAHAKLAARGASAAATVAALPEPPATAPHYAMYCVARHHSGLDDAATFADRVAPVIAEQRKVWSHFLACNAGTERWRAAIRTEITSHAVDALPAILGLALPEAPEVGVQFASDLLRHGHDHLVAMMWLFTVDRAREKLGPAYPRPAGHARARAIRLAA